MKRKILVIWTLVSSSLVMQIVGQPVYSVDVTSSFPATSDSVCSQTYQGTFESSTNYRACTVEDPQTGKVIYAGFGSDRFDWVQATRISAAAPAGDAELGPATAGCARPDGAPNDDWALACM
ncbi:MAG TPA: hypothetical protein VFV09_10080 [Actinomycetota bacterium]|nr:hypothetical protein [Actinomycetota bacterium]